MKARFASTASACAAMVFSAAAEIGTVGWWRFEGTAGEAASTVENAAQPGVRDATLASVTGVTVTYGETIPVTLTNATSNASGLNIAAPNNSYAVRFAVPDDDALRPTSVTAECFCRWDTNKTLGAGATAGLFGKNYGGNVVNTSYGVGFFANSWKARFHDGTKVYELTHTPTSGPMDGKWHHVAVTFDGTTLEAALWVDYVKRASTTLSGPLAYTAHPFYIGNVGGRNFIGTIDEVRVTDRVLTADEFLYAKPVKDILLPADEPAETFLRYRMGDKPAGYDGFLALAQGGTCA